MWYCDCQAARFTPRLSTTGTPLSLNYFPSFAPIGSTGQGCAINHVRLGGYRASSKTRLRVSQPSISFWQGWQKCRSVAHEAKLVKRVKVFQKVLETRRDQASDDLKTYAEESCLELCVKLYCALPRELRDKVYAYVCIGNSVPVNRDREQHRTSPRTTYQ